MADRGLLVLRLNETSLTTVGVLLGVVFIVAGVNEAGARVHHARAVQLADISEGIDV